MNIPAVPRKRRLDREEVRRLRANGYSLREIGTRLSASPEAARKAARELPPPQATVEDHGSGTWTTVEGADSEAVTRLIARLLKSRGYIVKAVQKRID